MKTPSDVANAVIGLTETKAIADILAAGCVSRVSSIDGVKKPGTMNRSTNRINLSIENGVVIEASVG